MRIEWSEDAVADLKAISEHIEQDRGIDIANRIARRIYDTIQSLSRLPNRGRNGRVPGTRELVIPTLPWIVVYSSSRERVMSLNIVHGAQRWP